MATYTVHVHADALNDYLDWISNQSDMEVTDTTKDPQALVLHVTVRDDNAPGWTDGQRISPTMQRNNDTGEVTILSYGSPR